MATVSFEAFKSRNKDRSDYKHENSPPRFDALPPIADYDGIRNRFSSSAGSLQSPRRTPTGPTTPIHNDEKSSAPAGFDMPPINSLRSYGKAPVTPVTDEHFETDRSVRFADTEDSSFVRQPLYKTPARTPVTRTPAHAPEFESDSMYGVRVFGFPQEQLSAIVARFQKFAPIVRRVPGNNWVDIYYRQPLHVEQALAANGKIMDGLVIGVMRLPDEPFSSDVSMTELSRSRAYDSVATPARSRTPFGKKRRDRDIELAPKTRGNICSRFFHYLLSWY